MKKEWEVLDCTVAFKGFFNLLTYRIRHSLFAGGVSEPIEREVLARGHAAAVIAYDPALDKILLIEQFRPGAMENADGPWMMEFIAGIVEAGENGEEVVRREAVEEGGIELLDVHHITTYYPSPGGSSETIALYWATADLSKAGGLYGLAEEGEDIRAIVHSVDEALAMLECGKINNSMTMILLLWFERERSQGRLGGPSA